jgi:hypothetical protein
VSTCAYPHIIMRGGDRALRGPGRCPAGHVETSESRSLGIESASAGVASGFGLCVSLSAVFWSMGWAVVI